MRDLIYNLPVMFTPRWAKSKSPPIALENILVYLVRLPEQATATGGIFEAAGPEYLSYRQMMRIMAEVAKRRRPFTIPLPFFTPRLSAFWMNLFSTVPINIARGLVDGLKYDFQAKDEELRQLIPQRLLDFREAVSAAFAAEMDHLLVSRWTEGAFTIGRHVEYTFYPNQGQRQRRLPRQPRRGLAGPDRAGRQRMVTITGPRCGICASSSTG